MAKEITVEQARGEMKAREANTTMSNTQKGQAALSGAQVGGAVVGYFMVAGAAQRAHKAQKSLAETQRKINEERVQKAYDANYASVMGNYVDARLSLADQLSAGTNQMVQTLNTVQGIDLAGSSFNYDTMEDALDQQFIEGLRGIQQEQISSMDEILSARVGQTDAVVNQFNTAVAQSRSVKDQMLMQAAQQVADAASKAASQMAGGVGA